MTRTVLITSGAYVGHELAAEFGRIPPSFLPVGNQRLFRRQISELKFCFDKIVLSVPDDYEISNVDRSWLIEHGVEIIPLPHRLSLRDSIIRIIAALEIEDGGLAILHGDTLLGGIDYMVTDSLSVAEAGFYYRWAGLTIEGRHATHVFSMLPNGGEPQDVLSGYFNFGDVRLLTICLAMSEDFVDSVDRYVKRRSVQAIHSERWLDFGHIHSYYSSRSRITTERSFNSLSIERRIVRKSSSLHRIDAESGWYYSIPANISVFSPKYLGRSDAENPGYLIEFLFNSSMADLIVFGELPALALKNIFASCRDFLLECRSHAAPADVAPVAMEMYGYKTISRLEEFAAESKIDLDHSWTLNGQEVPGLRAIAHWAIARIPAPSASHLSIVHGDFCFSNILYDFRSQTIRVLDPRGQDARGAATIYGDARYDLAKLYHSTHGQYDFIISGYIRAKQRAPYDMVINMVSNTSLTTCRKLVEDIIEKFEGENRGAVAAITLLLFLSMLPLHADNKERQMTLLANALRLYLDQKDD